ncbi:MAG: hypothetical protein ACFWT6_07490 [Virgibacillus proomii]|jgi:hypothetical protein
MEDNLILKEIKISSRTIYIQIQLNKSEYSINRGILQGMLFSLKCNKGKNAM